MLPGPHMQDDFIVAHLREPCSFCRTHVVQTGGELHRYIFPAGRPLPAPKTTTGRSFEGIRLEASGPSGAWSGHAGCMGAGDFAAGTVPSWAALVPVVSGAPAAGCEHLRACSQPVRSTALVCAHGALLAHLT
jgi:hypothetical protein